MLEMQKKSIWICEIIYENVSFQQRTDKGFLYDIRFLSSCPFSLCYLQTFSYHMAWVLLVFLVYV